MYHDVPTRQGHARSFGAWPAAPVDDLEAGRYVYYEDQYLKTNIAVWSTKTSSEERRHSTGCVLASDLLTIRLDHPGGGLRTRRRFRPGRASRSVGNIAGLL